MAGQIFPLVADRLPCEVVPLNFALDGSFPGRGPNPTVLEALVGLQAAVTAENADLGVAFDADGDRLLMVDECGRPLAGAVFASIVAEAILARHGPTTVVFDLTSGRALEERVAKAGGAPMIAPVGHSRIKERLLHEGGLFGAEESGHYYFRDFYCCDSGMLALLITLRVLASSGQPLSALAEGPRALYHRVPNENYLLPSREDAVECVKHIDGLFPDGEAHRLTRFGPDVRKDYEDWWFCVRPSGTEPRVLRLTVEARKSAMAEERMAALREPVLAWGGQVFVPPAYAAAPCPGGRTP
jgi:phosphomannomutase